MRNLLLRLTLCSCAALALSCRPAAPDIEPGEPTLRRLTEPQYTNSIHDLIDEEIFVPTGLEPDLRQGGLLALGAAAAALSPRGVENFEAAAYIVAEQAMEPELRDELLPCSPSGVTDDSCAAAFLADFGLRAWRRPLEADELDTLVVIAGDSAETLEDFHDGLEFAIAAVLMSPDFLYRVELGEPDPEGRWDRRFGAWELASRLSYLLWNTTPDDTLLAAAESGELLTDEGLEQELARLLESPRAREGLRSWFADMLHLSELDELYKDPGTFIYMSDTLGSAAREETLRGFEALVFDDDADLRGLMTTRRTFLDRELAMLYDVQAPSLEGFESLELDPEGKRGGLLGQASILALNSHPTSSSPTLRGKFVREVLLCQSIPAPPAGVDTSIPPPTAEAATLRDRVLEHLANPSCAVCHELTDPIGLALENFDGIGRFRTLDGGAPIDSSGEFDGAAFEGPVDLAEAIVEHEDFVPCIVETLTRYATGSHEMEGSTEGLDWLSGEFQYDRYRTQALVEDLVTSPLFLQAGTVEDPGE